jgi:glutamyl-tRNA synthetase
VERFTLERVGSSPAIFDYAKLEHLNGVYLRALPPGEYADVLVAFLREIGFDGDEAMIRVAAPLVQEKIATLGQFPEFAGFLFHRVDPPRVLLECDEATLEAARDALATLEHWNRESIESELRALAERLGLKPREAFQPVRIAVTGSKISPGLFESIELLGREETLARLDAALGS